MTVTRGLLALLAGGALAGATVPAQATPAAPSTTPPVIRVTSTDTGIHVTGPSSVASGRVGVVVDGAAASGGLAGLASFSPGYSFAQYVADYSRFESELFTDPADAVTVFRATMARVHYWGGVRAQHGRITAMTVVLPPGTYSLFDDSGAAPADPHTLTVTGPARTGTAPPFPVVSFRPGDTLAGPAALPRIGTVTVANEDPRSPHFLELARVVPGTTTQQVAEYFASGSMDPPAFLAGDEAGTDPLAPGGSETLSYALPAGTYLEYSYVFDPDTGGTDVAQGLFRLVTLG